MADIIERAEKILLYKSPGIQRVAMRDLIHDLIVELKAARGELATYTEFAESEFERLHAEAIRPADIKSAQQFVDVPLPFEEAL